MPSIANRSKAIKKRHAKPVKVVEEGEAEEIESDGNQAVDESERAPSPLLG